MKVVMKAQWSKGFKDIVQREFAVIDGDVREVEKEVKIRRVLK